MVTFIKEFEQYLLSESREESFQSIIPGSQADLYIQLSSMIKSISTDTDEIPRNVSTNFIHSFRYGQSFKNLKKKQTRKHTTRSN